MLNGRHIYSLFAYRTSNTFCPPISTRKHHGQNDDVDDLESRKVIKEYMAGSIFRVDGALTTENHLNRIYIRCAPPEISISWYSIEPTLS